MGDTTTTTRLEMRWVQVTNESGRVRMEAHWVDPAASAPAVAGTHAA